MPCFEVWQERRETALQGIAAMAYRNNSYDLLHQIYSQTGEYKKAYNYLSMLKIEDDSTFSINKARQINIMLKEYELEREQNQLLSKGLEEATVAQDSQKAQAWRTILILALITMFVVAVLALRNERIKSRTNRLLQLKNDEILAKNAQI